MFKIIFLFIILLCSITLVPEVSAYDIKLAELPRTGASQPQVISQQQLQIQELPRTGIPAIAWAAAALAPLGLSFFRKNKKSDTSFVKMWTKRELDK